MKRKILLVSAALLAAMCSFSVKADKVFYVDPDGNAPEGMTADAVYKTLAAAVAAATVDEPTTIYLKPGHTFSEGDVKFEQHADIKIIGNNTTLKGVQNKRILITRASRLELKGITFSGVDYTFGSGGAVFFRGDAGVKSTLVIDSCVFADNNVSGDSQWIKGGVAIATDVNDMDVTIKNSVFRNNVCGKFGEAMKGGTILHEGKNGIFEVLNSTFDGNSLTSATSGAIVIGIANGENVKGRLVNNTFFNNTTKSIPTGSLGNIFIHGAKNEVEVVNNTFYFDRREEDPGESQSDGERMKAVYKRTAAVNVGDGGNTLHFVNNVVVGLRSAVISAAKTGRTIECRNNYAIVLEPHVNITELADGENGNTLLVAREKNDGDPRIAHIQALDALLPQAGMAAALSTGDNFVPYLAFDETSPLVNAGIGEYWVGDVNMVPATDVRGVERKDGLVDIGAYEYVRSTPPGPGTGIAGNTLKGAVSVYSQAGRIVVENNSDEPLTLSLVQADGRRVASMPLRRSLVLDKADLPQGVLLLVMDNGTEKTTEKIIL